MDIILKLLYLTILFVQTQMTPTNVEKRKKHDEAEEGSHMQIGSKRQKTAEVDQGAAILGSIREKKQEHGSDQHPHDSTIGANELASAFALASLASMSPMVKRDKEIANKNTTIEQEYESRDADNDASSELGDHSHNTVHTISPEIRSPVRSGMQTPQNRRVTFSNDTKDTSRQTSRRLSLPPRVGTLTASRQQQQQHQPPPNVPFPPGYGARRNLYLSSPHHPQSPRLQQRSPSQQQHPWMRQQQQSHHRSNPPVTLFLPHLQHLTPKPQPKNNTPPTETSVQTWICDFCNVASFETYEEACIHEGSCRARTNAVDTAHLHRNNNNNRSKSSHPYPWPPPPQFHHMYSAPGPQQPYLVSHHMTGAPPPPPPSTPPIHFRPNASMTSPSTPRWQENQPAVGTEYTSISPHMSPGSSNNVHRTISTQESVEMTEGTDGSVTLSPSSDQQHQQQSYGNMNDGDNIVSLDDMELVPPYVYFLMRQVESTHFTEADRFVARSKGPVGYAGFQCRHCHGHAGLGKYFPVTAKSLSTNSTSQNIHSHLLKCRKVAPYIKEQLITLKDEKGRSPRLEPGWRRIFFEKIWSRLHD